jgi:bifunctional DNA-binding transcriptional regulator/antitoxin component of YhaV-PrlF toxin-antitoxin module
MSRSGFGEKRQADYEEDGPRSVDYTSLKIDQAGRVLIPAEMRAAMLTRPGDTLTARVVDGELRVVSRAWVMERIKLEAKRFRDANPDADLAEELIADRRDEARREDERWARLEREAVELRGDAGPRG